MQVLETARRFSGFTAVVLTAAALTACNATSGLPSLGAPAGADPGENTFRNLISGNATRAVAAATPTNPGVVKVNCPVVQVADGGAAYRVYNGADRSSAGVRYQYSLGELTRECIGTHAGQIEIRVGISGYVLAGPTGASGSFNVPVKVVVRNDNTQQIVSTRTYRIPTAIASGETQGTFEAVSDTVAVPILSDNADEDYSIYVGFDNGQPDQPRQPRNQRRRRA